LLSIGGLRATQFPDCTRKKPEGVKSVGDDAKDALSVPGGKKSATKNLGLYRRVKDDSRDHIEPAEEGGARGMAGKKAF